MTKLVHDLRLNILGYYENVKFRWKQSLVPNVSSRKKTLAIAVKKYAKKDIKVF